MHWDNYGFFGMHMFWWIFWLLAIVLLFSLTTPVPKSKARAPETPLDTLKRRYARGEINADEYEDRKSRLTRDHPAA